MTEAEVTRCKDCVSHVDESCPKGKVWCKWLKRYMKKDGYCSEGMAPPSVDEKTMQALRKMGRKAHGEE